MEILIRRKEKNFIEGGQTLKQVAQKAHKACVFEDIQNLTRRGPEPADLTLNIALRGEERRGQPG